MTDKGVEHICKAIITLSLLAALVTIAVKVPGAVFGIGFLIFLLIIGIF